MNSCILTATLVTQPLLRHTIDEQKVAEALVEFQSLIPEREKATFEQLKIIAWNKLAEALCSFSTTNQLLLQGRLSVSTLEKSGYKEKVVEMVLSNYPIEIQPSPEFQEVQVFPAAQAVSTPALEEKPTDTIAVEKTVGKKRSSNTGRAEKKRSSKSKVTPS